jgi:hypothetical protein
MWRKRLIAVVAVVLVAAWVVVTLTAPSRTTARPQSSAPVNAKHADPATLAAVFAKAHAGDTIVLAAGDYGTFRGALMPGPVTLAAAPGAQVRMAVQFAPASNIVLQGIDVTGLEIAGAASHDITVRDSRFDRSQAIIRTSDLRESDILFDHNVHAGFVKCAHCYEGRIDLVGRNRSPSGVTIRDSVFEGGNSDGIQNGGNGVRIIANTFSGIHQIDGADGVHADAIQLYGSERTLIRGNRMQDVATGIMAPDGTDHEVIEDNEIATAGYPFAVTLGGDDGSVVRGNQLRGGACHYGLRCGTLRIGPDKRGVASRGTVVEDNVVGALAIDAASRLGAEQGNRITG